MKFAYFEARGIIGSLHKAVAGAEAPEESPDTSMYSNIDGGR